MPRGLGEFVENAPLGCHWTHILFLASFQLHMTLCVSLDSHALLDFDLKSTLGESRYLFSSIWLSQWALHHDKALIQVINAITRPHALVI